ncbi:MAG: hypothetical protein R3C49_19570 [Planctomycetaceae bacterium]
MTVLRTARRRSPSRLQPPVSADGVDTVDVTDDDSSADFRLLRHPSVEGAGSAATTATVTRNTDTAGPLTVNLLSSDPSEATVATTVTILPDRRPSHSTWMRLMTVLRTARRSPSRLQPPVMRTESILWMSPMMMLQLRNYRRLWLWRAVVSCFRWHWILMWMVALM